MSESSLSHFVDSLRSSPVHHLGESVTSRLITVGLILVLS